MHSSGNKSRLLPLSSEEWLLILSIPPEIFLSFSWGTSSTIVTLYHCCLSIFLFPWLVLFFHYQKVLCELQMKWHLFQKPKPLVSRTPKICLRSWLKLSLFTFNFICNIVNFLNHFPNWINTSREVFIVVVFCHRNLASWIFDYLEN